jgi:lipid A 3-O-deacylase
MKKILKLIRIGLLAGLAAGTTQALAQARSDHPADNWEFGVDLGYLKKVKDNSPHDYVIAPVQLVWRTPSHFDLWRGENGARLTVRHRLAVVGEAFLRGPEDHYFGLSAAPLFELWTADQKTALFYEIGGGAGFVNSKGVPGGQGQDFTFHFFTQLGVRRQLSKTMAITGGAYFTHHSNMRMTNPNPGIDVLGLNVGLTWQLN